MSTKKRKKPYKPKKWATKVAKPVEVQFNIAQQVHNYCVASRMVGLFEQTVDEQGQQLYPMSVAFFDGKVDTYNEWFDVLGIDQERFDKVFDKLNKQRIKGDADAMYARIVEKFAQQEKQKFILASEADQRTLVRAKEAFDKTISKIKGG
jgi:hypothetical protein